MADWTIQDSVDLYGISRWGQPFVHPNPAGEVEIRPRGADGPRVSLKTLVDDLERRGIRLPVLLRFSQVLEARMDELVQAFEIARAANGHQGLFRGVYPIKVNQQRHVVHDVVRFGRNHHFGLEAGSKPELLVVLAMLDDPEALIICNGYKDADYIEMALLAQEMGRQPILVIEQHSEFAEIYAAFQKTGVRPILGVRARLKTRGSGRWAASSGDRSKFGLSVPEILSLVQQLREVDMLDCLQLLHFHIGSQVTDIRPFKKALTEASRIHVELVRLGAPITWFDAGGGLGVDYDGSATSASSSMNYTLQEYATDVVTTICTACNAAGIPHPNLVTEHGRALVAHHSVMAVNVLEASSPPFPSSQVHVKETDPRVLHELKAAQSTITPATFRAAWHDAVEAQKRLLSMFNLDLVNLETRARGERLFWETARKVGALLSQLEETPEELEDLPALLADTYFCNFSIFQSVPDSWAIEQVFPILPIHRLDEAPTRQAVLADLTCDSDGRIDRFIDHRGYRGALPVHPLNTDTYVLGIFMVGAYQEILGDLHNLFGDTHSVDVDILDDDHYRLSGLVEADTISEVLQYVAFEQTELLSRVRAATEQAVAEGGMSLEASAHLVATYQRVLQGSTYLA